MVVEVSPMARVGVGGRAARRGGSRVEELSDHSGVPLSLHGCSQVHLHPSRRIFEPHPLDAPSFHVRGHLARPLADAPDLGMVNISIRHT